MTPSEFKISISVKSYDEKYAENYQNCYVAEKCIVPYYQRYRSKILIAQIEVLSKYCQNVKFLSFITFREISRQRALESGRARSGRAGSGRAGSLF